MTDNTNPQDLIALLRTFIGDTQIVRAARGAADVIEQQAARIAELEAGRIAYASEFQLNADGEPDMGNVHANIRKIKQEAILFRQLLADLANEFVRIYPIYYYAEPWAHDRNVVLKTARAAIAASEPKNTGN